MSDDSQRTGHCLCGAVRFSATVNKPHVGACHCSMCRRWSSAPYMEIECAGVRFEGEEHITRFRSSDWAERGFCSKCGSNLFYRIIDSNDYQMAVGLFDDQSGLRFTLQVFTDKTPDFYAFANETKMLTGAEIFAMYAPTDDETT
ncbi:GFA family protein [Oceaniradius stylonematis]|uniref:GFA family protein n=1 Tax=Oceaniradius stylonematis TaxID=2184161 RepID=UPI00273DD129|nr:GFA family protein [Oceaniradius stylonematis]